MPIYKAHPDPNSPFAQLPLPGGIDLPGYGTHISDALVYAATKPYWVDPGIEIVIGMSPNDMAALTNARLTNGTPDGHATTYDNWSDTPCVIVIPSELDHTGSAVPPTQGGGTLPDARPWAWQTSIDFYTNHAPAPIPLFSLKVGVYIGNGTSQTINVGFDMTVAHASVFVKPGGGGSSARGAWRVTGLAGSSPIGTNTLDTDAITGFTANGFSVGSNTRANANGVGYAYVAMADTTGATMQVGTYTGLGNTSTSITVTNTGDHFAACNFNSRWIGAVLDFGGGNQYCILGGVPGVSIQFSPGWNGALGTPVIGTVLSDNRLISLSGGMVPTHVWVVGGSQLYRSPEMAAGQSVSLGANGSASPMVDGIKGPSTGGSTPCGGQGSSGFVIGTNSDVNHDAFIYAYMALRQSAQLAPLFASGTKNPAAGSDTISGLSFSPGFVATIDAAALQNGVWRVTPNGQVGTDSTGWAGNPDGVLDVPTQGIRSITGDGFTTGTTSMPAGHEVYWFAFKGQGTASGLPPGNGTTTPSCAIGTAFVGLPYAGQIAVTGGSLPYYWILVGGALPPGLTLNPTTGVISGTPTTAGSYSYAVKVVDATMDPNAAIGIICSITVNSTFTPTPPAPPPTSPGPGCTAPAAIATNPGGSGCPAPTTSAIQN